MSRNAVPESSSPVLVGRSAELRALAAAVTRPPAVVLLEGEAGIGKTRLLTELLRLPEVAARRPLVGYCQPMREPFPYGVVLEALREAGAQLATAELSPVTGVLRPYLPELAAFLPEPPEAADSRSERHRMFRAVRELLEVLGPAVLVVEDLHWSDDGSRQLLRFLTADLPPGLSLLLTYRREELPGGITLGRAFRPAPGTSSEVIELTPFDAEGVRRLTTAILGESEVSPDFAALLHERTAGIPFVVEETLRTLRGAEGAVYSDGATAKRLLDNAEVPALLREAMLERLSGLPIPARRLAHAAAVLGMPASREMLAEVAGLLPGRADEALTRLLDTQVLRESGHCRYGFRHTLAQQAVYRTLAGPDRQLLHQRAAKALATAEPPPLVRLAEHSRRGGDQAGWLRHGEAAADRAAEVGDPSTATGLLKELLTDGVLADADVDRLAVKLSRVAVLGVAQQHQVIEVLEGLLTDHRLAEGSRGQVRLNLGLLLIRQEGGQESGRTEIETAIHELGERDPLALRGMSALAQPFIGTTPVAEHLRWMSKVDGLIADVTDPAVLLTLIASNGPSRLHIGDPGAWELLARLPAHTEARAEQQQLARAHCNIGDACAWTGHLRRAESQLRTGIRLAHECGASYLVSIASATRMHLNWLTGDWDSVSDRARRLAEEYRELRPVADELSLVLGSLAVAKGEWDRAARYFADSGIGRAENAVTPVALAAHGGMIRTLLAKEDVAGAAAAADDGLRLLRRKGVWSWAGELVPPAVIAYCEAGRIDAADALLGEFAAAIDGLDTPMADAALAEARGVVEARRGDQARAVEFLTEARAGYAALPAPYYAALVGVRLLELSPAPDGELAALAEEFTALGATRDAARCRHLLRVSGVVAPSRRGRRGYGNELSPRERDVARLVAGGSTNREIAEVLFLSRRTVEQHVANVLRKLDLHSRADLRNSEFVG
ncbi:Putative HTH-type transcriptional regulator [Amycolatopsis sp. YIM 10]|nr:Putative HTH-type transcriptional regulator [Amycolatopsis sp. YIM 10]